MHVFNAKVRLGGELNNEVAKRGLTVPEILVLKRLHGESGVVALEHSGVLINYDAEEERERLTEMYDTGLAALHEKEKTSIKGMFSEYGPLPAKLGAFNGPYVKEQWQEIEDAQASLPFTSPDALSATDERRSRREARRAAKEVAPQEVATLETKSVEKPRSTAPVARPIGQAQQRKGSSADSIAAVL